MSRLPFAFASLVALLSVCATGCSSQGSLYDDTAAAGIRRLGSSGGTLESTALAARALFPRGSLRADVSLQLSSATDAPTGASRAITLRPDDIELLLPATLEFMLEPGRGEESDVIARLDGETWLPLTTRRLPDRLTASIPRLGTFGLVAGGGEACTPQCSPGTCGPDGCDGWCGPCGSELECVSDLCVPRRCEREWRLSATLDLAGEPHGLASADFNKDNRKDLVTANAKSSDVSVLLGRGDGTFEAPQRFPCNFQPYEVVTADLDGDGQLDLVVANEGETALSVLRGRGDGTFATARRFESVYAPSSLAIADLDLDGELDIVANSVTTPRVAIHYGDGAGGLSDPQLLDVWASEVAAGDLDGDGRADLILAREEALVYFTQPGRRFVAGPKLEIIPGPTGIWIGDLGDDGRADIAVASYNGGGPAGLVVWSGRDGGLFERTTQLYAGQGFTDLAVGDLDGDGALDLATSSWSASAHLFLNKGGGRFEGGGILPASGHPWAIVIDDFNGDKRAELATAGTLTGSVYLSACR